MALEDDVSDILKKARLGQGLTTAEVARRADLPESAIVKMERGARIPERDEIEALAPALGLRADPLGQIARQQWEPAAWHADADSCPVVTVVGDIGGYAVNGYVLYDPGTRRAVVIDTAYAPERMVAELKQRGLELVAVCLTHGHLDHAGGLEQILAFRRVPVYFGMADQNLMSWQPPQDLVAPAEDGGTIRVGDLTVQALETPGHTPGGFCFTTEYGDQPLCFVGDTLFAGSIGRANPFSLYPRHLESLRQRLLSLPSSSLLFPGHGPSTTVHEEREHNPFAAAS